MSSNERVTVECPNCGHRNGFSKKELCGSTRDFARKDKQPSPRRRRVSLNGHQCYNCGYDFSQQKITIDCEGYE